LKLNYTPMKPSFKLQISVFVLFSFFIQSCNVNNNTKSGKNNVDIPDTNIILTSSIEVFKTMPSPVQAAELITNSGAKFDEKILNPVKNIPYYESSQSMALNLGVYCSDLSFTSFYDQKQITLEYLSAIKTLADGLGLIDLLKQSDIVKLEENLYNKDSIKALVQEIFLSSGQFLNDNNRPEIALMVEVGSWVEALYIAMQLARQSGYINKELVDRVSEQRNSLLMVISSLENFSNIEQVNTILIDMYRLKTIYDKMVIPPGENLKSSTLLTSEKNTTSNITPEIFLSLYHEIGKIRNSYTQ